jgi:hypothetical protein
MYTIDSEEQERKLYAFLSFSPVLPLLRDYCKLALVLVPPLHPLTFQHTSTSPNTFNHAVPQSLPVIWFHRDQYTRVQESLHAALAGSQSLEPLFSQHGIPVTSVALIGYRPLCARV